MIEVEHYFFDDEDDLWADIHCNGRRQWCMVVGCDHEHWLYRSIWELGGNHELGCEILASFCRKFDYETRILNLPHIEDASEPMRMAWKGADEWDDPHTSLGYYLNEEQFQEDYMMTSAEFKKQLQADIDKYGIGDVIFEERDGESLYSASMCLCEYFTEAINDG